MILNRRDLLKYALGMPAAAWLTNFRALAQPASKMVKITGIKTMGLDNLNDGCLIRIDTDAGSWDTARRVCRRLPLVKESR